MSPLHSLLVGHKENTRLVSICQSEKFIQTSFLKAFDRIIKHIQTEMYKQLNVKEVETVLQYLELEWWDISGDRAARRSFSVRCLIVSCSSQVNCSESKPKEAVWV